MRKEKIGVGDFVHIYSRGTRKTDLFTDYFDKYRFIQSLYYFNNTKNIRNIFDKLPSFSKKYMRWPRVCGSRDPLVEIHAFVLMDNHYHLVLQEIKEGGIAKFMHKFGTSYSKYFNIKHSKTGHLFESTYNAVRINNDRQLKYIFYYLFVKNVQELLMKHDLLSRGSGSIDILNSCFEYEFSSAKYMFKKTRSPVICDNCVFEELFTSKEQFFSYFMQV